MPLTLAAWHAWETTSQACASPWTLACRDAVHLAGAAAVRVCLPFHKTGYIFGNPQYVRYDAVRTLHLFRFFLALGQRLMQVTIYMNLFVPILCMVAAMFLPALRKADGTERPRVSWCGAQIGLLAAGQPAVFFGCRRRCPGALPAPALPADFAALRFYLAAPRRAVAVDCCCSVPSRFSRDCSDPPYRFTPEDNLTYRSLIIMQQQAIAQVIHRAPGGTC